MLFPPDGPQDRRAAAGEIRTDLDPVVTAQALVGMSARVVAWWIENPSRATRNAVIDTLTNIQIGGTTPPTGLNH